MVTTRFSIALACLASLFSCKASESDLKGGPSYFGEDDHYLPWEADEDFEVTGFPGVFSHQGLQEHSWDFNLITGTPVLATVDGTVRRIQYSESAPVYGGESSRGLENYVILSWADGSGRESAFLHLSSIAVEEGDEVPRGTVLGQSGCTGWCTADHLHYQVQEGPEDGTNREESYYRQSVPMNFHEYVPTQREFVVSENNLRSASSSRDSGSKSESIIGAGDRCVCAANDGCWLANQSPAETGQRRTFATYVPKNAGVTIDDSYPATRPTHHLVEDERGRKGWLAQEELGFCSRTRQQPMVTNEEIDPSICRCRMASCKLNQKYAFDGPTTVRWINDLNLGSVGDEPLEVLRSDAPESLDQALVVKVKSTRTGGIGWLKVDEVTSGCFP